MQLSQKIFIEYSYWSQKYFKLPCYWHRKILNESVKFSFLLFSADVSQMMIYVDTRRQTNQIINPYLMVVLRLSILSVYVKTTFPISFNFFHSFLVINICCRDYRRIETSLKLLALFFGTNVLRMLLLVKGLWSKITQTFTSHIKTSNLAGMFVSAYLLGKN